MSDQHEELFVSILSQECRVLPSQGFFGVLKKALPPTLHSPTYRYAFLNVRMFSENVMEKGRTYIAVPSELYSQMYLAAMTRIKPAGWGRLTHTESCPISSCRSEGERSSPLGLGMLIRLPLGRGQTIASASFCRC